MYRGTEDMYMGDAAACQVVMRSIFKTKVGIVMTEFEYRCNKYYILDNCDVYERAFSSIRSADSVDHGRGAPSLPPVPLFGPVTPRGPTDAAVVCV
jgi:hypothetical protein